MLLAALTLAHLLNECAPNIGRRTMTAIVRVESGGNPLLIRDNSLDRTFAPHDADQGVVWANQLLKLGHSIDLGISQINDANLPRLGLSVREAFDPCINVHGGATILASDYRAAASEFGQGQYALRRAIGAYNSGSLYGGYGYIAKILAAVGIAADDDFRVPELQSVALPAPSLRPPGFRATVPREAIARRTARGGPLDPYSAPILVSPSGPAAATAAVPAPAANVATAKPAVAPAPVRVAPERSPILAGMPPVPLAAATPAAKSATVPSPSPSATSSSTPVPSASPAPIATSSPH